MLVYQYEDATDACGRHAWLCGQRGQTAIRWRRLSQLLRDPGNILDPNTRQPVTGLSGGLRQTINLQNQFARYQIFPQRTSHSVYATASQQVGGGVELFAEGRFTNEAPTCKTFPKPRRSTYLPPIRSIPSGPKQL